jgi:hypothetical protein
MLGHRQLSVSHRRCGDVTQPPGEQPGLLDGDHSPIECPMIQSSHRFIARIGNWNANFMDSSSRVR